MKNYTQLGELLTDYRAYNNLSQATFAAKMDVDVRTISRWEMNQSLVKPGKEKMLAEVTFIPYQVIRNLNALVPIPTFYDFALRKYALSERSNKLPPPTWIKEHMEHTSPRIRSINTPADREQILKYIRYHDHETKQLNPQIIEEAAKLRPELNLIIFDEAGYYAGHSVILPIKPEIYQKLKTREIKENQLSIDDLAHFIPDDHLFFHALEITADCNENIFYLLGALLRFFAGLKQNNYTFSSITARHDSRNFNEQMGLKLIWEDHPEQEKSSALRFYEGDFHAFLSRKE